MSGVVCPPVRAVGGRRPHFEQAAFVALPRWPGVNGSVKAMQSLRCTGAAAASLCALRLEDAKMNPTEWYTGGACTRPRNLVYASEFGHLKVAFQSPHSN